jgi:hypothetical protein
MLKKVQEHKALLNCDSNLHNSDKPRIQVASSQSAITKNQKSQLSEINGRTTVK